MEESTMTRQEAENRLRGTFNLPVFYDNQWDAIQRILNKERVLLIEKTGFGKSLCYQFPATVFSGTTVIFSPLLSLMRDQVKKMTALGISAACINSEQLPEENQRIMADAVSGNVKILYIAPERMENHDWINISRQISISMVVVDEAHCISVWGHDFRPAFRRIIDLIKFLPADVPVLATTATATKRVEKDIANQIGGGIQIIRGHLMRENLKLFVLNVENDDEKFIWLGKVIPRLPGNGIIYTGTRADTEIYSHWLEDCGISSVHYSSKRNSESRVRIENGFMENKWKCIVATNALGMGIDKKDIRFIIHTQIPQSPIHYYQEIGRAGRDGGNAYIILLYRPGDKRLPLSFIHTAKPSIKDYQKVTDAIKDGLLGEKEITMQSDLKKTTIRTILADLMDAGIIRKIPVGRSSKYEFIPGSKSLDTSHFAELKKVKLKELDDMVSYVKTTESRMKYLTDYLGDSQNKSFANCDNTGEKKMRVVTTPEWRQKLDKFQGSNFPILEVKARRSHLVSGIAGSYYGVTDVGKVIHKCKYQNGGDFPDSLVALTVNAYQEKLKSENFDLILYVPSTVSGDLVKNFAEKVADRIHLPVSHKLKKTRNTSEQKIFITNFLKSNNVKDAFTVSDPSEVEGKSILLIDDIFDSGATIKEIAAMLTKMGATKIAPLVIAKTVGGDLADDT